MEGEKILQKYKKVKAIKADKPTKKASEAIKKVNKKLDEHQLLLVEAKVVEKPKRSNKYGDFVKSVMKDKKMKMIEAVKYIKENNLYKKE